jgi:hypothetical protein
MSGPKKDHVGPALDALDGALDWFHDKVLRPIILVGRFIAFGMILVVVGLVVLVALLIEIFRLLDVYAFGSHQWASYLVVGTVLVLAGLVVWRKRRPVRLRG